MRLSKLSIRKLKKYVDFLHQFDCDIMIHYSGNQTAFLVDIDSVPNDRADTIEIHNYITSETFKEFRSINSFLIYLSPLYKKRFCSFKKLCL